MGGLGSADPSDPLTDSSPSIFEYPSSSWSYAMTLRWYLMETSVAPPAVGSASWPVNLVAGSTKKSHWLASA